MFSILLGWSVAMTNGWIAARITDLMQGQQQPIKRTTTTG